MIYLARTETTAAWMVRWTVRNAAIYAVAAFITTVVFVAGAAFYSFVWPAPPISRQVSPDEQLGPNKKGEPIKDDGMPAIVRPLVSQGETKDWEMFKVGEVWSGTGTALLDNGKTEKLFCSATYRPTSNGSTLNQLLNCASDHRKLNLVTDLVGQQRKEKDGQIYWVVEDPKGFAFNLTLWTKGVQSTLAIRGAGDGLKDFNIIMVANPGVKGAR
jgi:hypothetical protein